MKNEIVIGAIAVAAALVGYLYWQSTRNEPATTTQQTTAPEKAVTATPQTAPEKPAVQTATPENTPNTQSTAPQTTETATPSTAESTQATTPQTTETATPPAEAPKQ